MKKRLTTHDFTATYQEGVVSQIDPKTHRIKATIPALEDLETAWLPFSTLNAGGNQFYALPDVGELVAMVLDARGESGYVLGTIYNSQDPVPVDDNEMWMFKFKNGTEISHNRQTGDVVINTKGKVIVTASQAVVNAPTEINGNTTINGSLQATGAISSSSSVDAPSVTSNGVSLDSHTHARGASPDK
ncbi:phage baseplate assembly protein V [Histophilus somni]|uniref:phage baseplate assembly protein V n=1 Tax=Histophilus somni TaxID=731 RepID=UPI00094A9F5B|nr:phage baseplate assembly protein V [Histophilus somni]THA21170.1 phage baseplate assembly protein V [Histophilus somni]